MNHLVVVMATGVIVVAAVVAVLELVTFALLAVTSGLRLFVRTVRALVRGGRSRRTSGSATAVGVEGSPAAVAPTPESALPAVGGRVVARPAVPDTTAERGLGLISGTSARTSPVGVRAGLKPSPFLEERMTTTIDSFAGDDWSVLFPPGDVYGTEYSGTYSVHDAAQVEDITPERIARIDASYLNEGDYAETDLAALVELTDGTWAAVMAWCDTTGWGCQSGVQWKWGRTREDVISQGLDNAAREAMGLETEPTTSTPERSA